MALLFDLNGLPSCCGKGLIPGDPFTRCPICAARFDTAQLAAEFKRLRTGAQNTAMRTAAAAAVL